MQSTQNVTIYNKYRQEETQLTNKHTSSTHEVYPQNKIINKHDRQIIFKLIK